MSKKKPLNRFPNLRDHNMYLWLCTEMRTLIDSTLAVSTQYEWEVNEEDHKFILDIMDRDIRRIANTVAREAQS